jgi:hypothetical protein
MKKFLSELKGWYLVVILGCMLIGFGCITVRLIPADAPKPVKVNKAMLTDSIAKLNQIIKGQQREILFIDYQLDSISKKGGSLNYTNHEKKMFEITVTPKK